MTVHKISTVARVDFNIYDGLDDPVTTLVNGDFTKLLSKDGVDSAVVITVTHIGSGRYTATFTPDANGIWTVTVRQATHNKRGIIETFQVTADGAFDLDSISVDGKTWREILRLHAAYMGGTSSGGALDDAIKGIDGVKTRITSTIDANGHRTSVNLDLSP